MKHPLTYALVTVFSLFANSMPAAAERLLDTPELWERIGGAEDSFVLEKGSLRAQWSGHEPAAMLTSKDYENFDLSFEFNMGHWCESGLYLHVPRNGAYRAGVEIEIADDAGHSPSPLEAGAIFDYVAPKAVTVHPYDEWNSCRVHMDWPRLVIHINDTLVQDLDLSQDESLKYKLRRGAIGFQHLGLPLEVRNLDIQPLPDTEKGVVLFNGKNFTGWKEVKGDTLWSIKDGAIVGADYNGYLGHQLVCQDFDLRAMIRTSPASNGGIFFRWLPGDLDDRGHEIQILDVPGSHMVTGSVYGIERGNDLALTPGEWELLQVSVRGSHAITFVNGLKCAETHRLKAVRPGNIVLQMHKTKSWVAFKDLVLVPRD
jgi:hypothetical protein